MKKKKFLGRLGEEIAIEYLKGCEYEILEKNYYTRHGEIDIVGKSYLNEIVFIEVKTRSNLKYGRPAEAVNTQKLQHMKFAANVYLQSKKIKNIDIRFDVIEVLVRNGKIIINHIKQII